MTGVQTCALPIWLLATTQLRPAGYPDPVVDLLAATERAKALIHERKAEAATQREARAVYDKHGSRHPGREATTRRAGRRRADTAGDPQLSLLGDADGT